MTSWWQRLTTAGWAIGLLLGLPIALAYLAGLPRVPNRSPSRTPVIAWIEHPLTPATVTAAAAAVAWLMWAALLAATVVEFYNRAAQAHRRLPHLHLPGPMRTLAAAMLGTLTASSPAALAATAATTAPATGHLNSFPDPVSNACLRSATSAPAGPEASAATITTAQPISHSPATTAPIHRVIADDNLWNIAAEDLGNPHRWPEINALNLGRTQPDGHALTNPDLIHIGWALTLPAPDSTAPPPAVPPPGAEPAPTSPPHATIANPPANPSPTSSAAPAPGFRSHPAPSQPASGTPRTAPDTTTTRAPQPTEISTSNTPAKPYEQPAGRGIRLPSQGWISLGLAATICAVAALLRLSARRRARLAFPIPTRTGPRPSPVPAALAPAEAAGIRLLNNTGDPADPMSALATTTPPVPAPVGLTRDGQETSLFTVPGTGIALCGDGAEAAMRAILAAVLATGVLDPPHTRPVVAISRTLLARLLPPGVPPVGLDPDHDTFDGERLIVLTDPAAAITHAEEELIARHRMLDAFDEPNVTALNARTDHAEHLPAYVLLVEAAPRHGARVAAVAARRHTLNLHPVVLGDIAGLPTYILGPDGTTTSDATGSDATSDPAAPSRWATLAADDLATLLLMVADAAARPETGVETGTAESTPDNSESATTAASRPADDPELIEAIPQRDTATPAPVRLKVLGTVSITTAAGAVTSGLRRGSKAALALLAAYPAGRTLVQITDALYPDDAHAESAANRVRSDLTTLRRVLRAATGEPKTWFVLYSQATGLYRLDPSTFEVDLWTLLNAITRANLASDDPTCLAALQHAVSVYGGEFADGIDQPWSTDYATTYRHQILGAHARIAEITESDRPDQAVAALEAAITLDPVNEELHQRLMRIHGRLGHPDAVRRVLRQLEARLADLGAAEPSEATRRVAQRQLLPAPAGGAHR